MDFALRGKMAPELHDTDGQQRGRNMACPSGKHPYRNRMQAIRTLLRIRFDQYGRFRKDRPVGETAWYLCQLCSRYHLTSWTGGPTDLGLNDLRPNA